VGGDLYDFNILDEEILSFAIGDASGHGLPAALLARDIVTGLRMGIENEMKISGVIRKLNRVIHQSRLSTKFVSLVFGELERNGTLVYINAGHPPPLHFKKDAMNRLDVGGTILGPLSDSVFKRGFAFMDPGGHPRHVHGRDNRDNPRRRGDVRRSSPDRPRARASRRAFAYGH
jgi:serine phosphatase RsbU (regulator of sigma subunit)